MDTFLFWLSKILWSVFTPTHFVVILLLCSFMFIKSNILNVIIRMFAGLFLCAALLFPIGDWALLPLEQCSTNQGMPMKVDGVLVLGGAVNTTLSDARKSIAFNDSAERVLGLLKLIKQFPNAQFVYAGGSNSLKPGSQGEAEYVRQFLDEVSMHPSSMVFESQSRNTYEDAMLSKETWAKTPKQNWLLVTSAFHMPRSFGLFEKIAAESQTSFYPYAVDYKTIGQFKFELRMDMLQTLLKFDTAAHEYAGLLVNKVMKRSDRLFPCLAQVQTHLL